MKRTAFVLVAFTLAVSGCSTQERTEWRNGPPPECGTTSRGRLLLMAQSVPEATLIPCIGDLPPGWEFSGASSRTSESILAFSTDTFDLDADVTLTGSCDVSAAVEADSPRTQTRLFLSDDGRTLSFTFDGGCIQFVYETRQLAESNEGSALVKAVPFMTRDTLRELSGWSL